MSYFILRIYSTTNDRDLSNMIARKDQKYVLPLSPKGVRIVPRKYSFCRDYFGFSFVKIQNELMLEAR